MLVLLAANAMTAGWAFILIKGHGAPLAMVGLAYLLGLKHALDADHIAAIDNVSRKLVGEGRPPIWAGLFFSLGHSSVVVAATAAIALAGPSVAARLALAKSAGATIGALTSGVFLLLVAAVNARALWMAIRRPNQSHSHLSGKLLVKVFRPLFRLITRSWHMYPLGVLFGLGFDTASEIALLALATNQAGMAQLGWRVLIYPALFAAGMTVIDTAGGLIASRAYDRALHHPDHPARYNLIVTLVSVLAATGIGGAELLGLFTGTDPLSGVSTWAGGGLCVLLMALWAAMAGSVWTSGGGWAPPGLAPTGRRLRAKPLK